MRYNISQDDGQSFAVFRVFGVASAGTAQIYNNIIDNKGSVSFPPVRVRADPLVAEYAGELAAEPAPSVLFLILRIWPLISGWV